MVGRAFIVLITSYSFSAICLSVAVKRLPQLGFVPLGIKAANV